MPAPCWRREAAFQLALDAGVDGIEVDVQLTRDHRLVICHDEEISRVSNGHGKVREYTCEELNRFDFGSWFDARYCGQRIVLLADLFDLVRGRETIINVEIKGDPGDHPLLVEELVLLLERYQMERRVIVSSFFHSALSLVKQRSPHTSLGVLYECGPLEPWLMVESVGAGALHPRWRFVTQELVAQAHERGYRINAWTLDSARFIDDPILFNFFPRPGFPPGNFSHAFLQVGSIRRVQGFINLRSFQKGAEDQIVFIFLEKQELQKPLGCRYLFEWERIHEMVQLLLCRGISICQDIHLRK